MLCTGWGPLGCEGEISGRIVDSQGRAVNGAKVFLYIRTIKLMETKTDNAGLYRFENIVWGSYDIKAKKDGYLESPLRVSLGESYACSEEVPDIILWYDNMAVIISKYYEFLEGISGDSDKLNNALRNDFKLTFTGDDEVVCSGTDFCRDCPVPERVSFTSSNIDVIDNTATIDVTFVVQGVSEEGWSSKLGLAANTVFAIPSWKVVSWDIGLHDFKPASEADRGWADPDGYIEYDSEIDAYRWKCVW